MNADEAPAWDDFRVHYPLEVRLADCDHYAHVNNAVYYEYFDTAINAWLSRETGTYVGELPALGLVIASSCRYFRELTFPDQIAVGIRVGRVGRTSVEYRPAIFRLSGREPELAASGSFVHVYVAPQSRRPVPVPAEVREVLSRLG